VSEIHHADADAADARDARLLATFLEIVRIDSPAGSEEAFAEDLSVRLAALGCSVRMDDAEPRTDSSCGNLIAELPGTAPGPRLVLSAHMDTVMPGRGIVPVVEDGVVRSQGETILGADDKAGIAAILECLERITEGALPHPDLRVILTVGEEVGLMGAKALDPSDIVGDLCLVLDADGAPGGIVTSAPTHYTFKATFTGHASHAGVEPEKGRSAVAMACHAVTSMRSGRLDAETTANIGVIQGGVATNVVAASCILTGECRSRDPEKAEAARAEMEAAMRSAASGGGGAVTTWWTKEYDGFSFAEDDPLLALVESACRDAGLEPRRFATGGGSDGNIFSAKGLPSLVLSSGMTNVHGTSESVRVEDLSALARLLLAVVARSVGAAG
jgi:tripeptide aminopeptidase